MRQQERGYIHIPHHHVRVPDGFHFVQRITLLLHQGVKFGVQIVQHVKDRVGRTCRRQRCKFNNVGEQDGACSSKELVVVVHDVQREREREWHSSKWHSRKWHLNRHGQWYSKRQRQQWFAKRDSNWHGQRDGKSYFKERRRNNRTRVKSPKTVNHMQRKPKKQNNTR